MIVPIDVNDTVLVASNITETDYPAWNSGTTYALAARVIVVATHSIYESAQAGNINHDPTTDDPISPVWWVRVGATNKWKAFDDVIQDQAVKTGGITYELDVASRADGIALFNLDASSVTVQVDDPIVARRNLFTATEDLADPSWFKAFATDNGSVTGPTGAMDARSFTFTSIAGGLSQSILPELFGVFTMSFKARSDDLTQIRLFSNINEVVTISNEWASVSMVIMLSSIEHVGIGCPTSGVGTVEICDLQIEVGTSTEYQSVDAAGVWSLTSYDQTRDLQDYSEIEDYWLYFFEPIEKLDAVVFENVPAFAGTTVFISINSDDDAKVGEIALGQNFELGRTHAGASVGIQDFSRRERDTFGNWVVIERAYSDRMDLNFTFDATKIASMRRQLAARRAKPTVFHEGVGSEQYGLLTYGFYKDINFPIVTLDMCVAALEIEGLT